ncbi:MAG: hypothetical protein HFJ80_04720 [Clostridiales bacterium]|nr:hypothetical protein [Clostridiales bacterium]
MKGRFSLNRILHNNRLIMLISLLLAVALWVSVLYGSGNDEDRTVTLGTISLQLTEYAAETRGLTVVEGGEVEVTVVVTGPRFLINKDIQSEIRVRGDMTSVVEPGSYTIPLTATGGSGYTIREIRPQSVDIQVDTMDIRDFPLSPDTSAVTVPNSSEYRLGDTIIDSSVINTSHITVMGPSRTLAQISRVAALVEKSTTITKVTVFPAPLVALDASGNTVNTENCIFYDKDGNEIRTLNLTVPVSISKEVSFTCGLNHMPDGLAEDASFFTLSPSSAVIWGPADALAEYTGDLGTLDFDNLGLGSFPYKLPLNLRGGLQAENNLREVTISLNRQDMNSKFISIPLTEGKVRYLNNPTNQSPVLVRPDGELMESIDVSIQGPAASVEEVTAENLSVTIDLQNAVVSDGAVYPARIAISGYRDLWVYYGNGDLHGINVILNAQ